MLVIFQRTGRRQYRVEVRRPPFVAVEMNPAPGYDDLMPHDMMHLVVESQLRIERGIFGQIAAGGGTFRVIPDASKTTRDAARQRRRLNDRGKKMMRTAETTAYNLKRPFTCAGNNGGLVPSQQTFPKHRRRPAFPRKNSNKSSTISTN